MTPSFDLPSARLVWAHQQQLSGPRGALAAVPGGWSRALGGVDPYLALRGRLPDLERSHLDGMLDDQQLFVVPGARNCIWVVPRADVSLALRVSEANFKTRTLRDLAKLGADEDGIVALSKAALPLLEDGPKTPGELRATLGDKVLSLGTAGKKKGYNTTLPTALRLLETRGLIARRPENMRADTNRYAWALAETNLLELGDAPTDAMQQAIALARLFFEWAGPAPIVAFAEWAALGKRVAKKACDASALNVVTVGGLDSLATDRQLELLTSPPAPDGRVVFLPAQDNLVTLRSSPARLAPESVHQRQMVAMGGKTSPLADSRWIHERPVVRDGEWIGLWAWDQDAERVVAGTFDAVNAATRGAVAAEAEATADWIRRELACEARCTAIDGPKSKRRRVDSVLGLEHPAT